MNKRIKNKNGEAYIDTVITMLISVLIIFVTINLFSIYYTYVKVNNVATEMSNYVAIQGVVKTSDVKDQFDELCEDYKLDNVDISFTDSEIIPTEEGLAVGAVQYGDKISVTVACSKTMPYVSNTGKIDIPITVTKITTSKNYWKP